jgi:hypothetical protein
MAFRSFARSPSICPCLVNWAYQIEIQMKHYPTDASGDFIDSSPENLVLNPHEPRLATCDPVGDRNYPHN